MLEPILQRIIAVDRRVQIGEDFGLAKSAVVDAELSMLPWKNSPQDRAGAYREAAPFISCLTSMSYRHLQTRLPGAWAQFLGTVGRYSADGSTIRFDFRAL